MPLELLKWESLSKKEKDDVVRFLKDNCKIDAEIPESQKQQYPGQFPGSYTITEGTTSGGNPMKYGKEFRIYIRNIENCPKFLRDHCVQGTSTYAARIGGTEAIKAIMNYGGLKLGCN